MVDQNEQGKADQAAILSQRREQYTHAIVKAAIAMDGKSSQWKNCLTSVQLSRDKPAESISLAYPGFEIHVAVEKPERVLELIGGLVNEGKFNIAGRDISLSGGRFDWLGPSGQRVGQRVSSGEAWVRNEWPGDQYLFVANREITSPSHPLAGLEMPAYPDGRAAIEHMLGMDVSGGHTWDGGVYFFFPDYRVRIETVTSGIQSFSIKLGLGKMDLQNLVGKVYAKNKLGDTQQKDIEFETPEARIELGFQPEHTYVGLLCRSDGQILDQWEHSPFRRSSKEAKEPFTPENVLQLIGGGEDNHVEFKPGKKEAEDKREIAETAIAFSNKEGGVILVGIDDHGHIEGAFGGGWEDLIAQSLRDRCDPPIEPTVRRVVLDDKHVYVVEISESNNKPHLMKGTGIAYIRVGSTDKPVTRYELDEFYRRRESIKGFTL